jgi:serine/threonine protein phosphatase 1
MLRAHAAVEQLRMIDDRLYAIGDIHGSLDKLRNLVARCEQDAGGRPMSFVFVGDYIDRGPDSRGVVAYLMELQARMPGRVTTLMGNHEVLALAAIEGSTDPNFWLLEGGGATLRSYGATRPHALPGEHVDWLRSLRLTHDDGRRLFVHAGVNPEKPLDAQDDVDLLWIREPFLSDARDYGRLIVHGHTPTRSGLPDLRSNRLNIDTGAVFGGALTAAMFQGDGPRPAGFLQARA